MLANLLFFFISTYFYFCLKLMLIKDREPIHVSPHRMDFLTWAPVLTHLQIIDSTKMTSAYKRLTRLSLTAQSRLFQ